MVFYGKTVNLKRLFGDDELDTLAVAEDSYLSGFNHLYSESYALDGLTDGYNLVGGSLSANTDGTMGDLCYPFISGSSHYYYDTLSNPPSLNEDVVSRNVINNTGINGIYIKDLKPAIRLYHIILGIEDKYGIEFTKDTGSNNFFATDNEEFYQLYLWLHREKGDIDSQLEEESVSIALDGYTFIDTTPASNPDPRSGSDKNLEASFTIGLNESTEVFYEYTVDITPTPTTGLYSLELIDTQTGNEITPTSSATDISGASSTTFVIRKEGAEFGSIGVQTFTPVLKVKTRAGITEFDLDDLFIKKVTRVTNLGTGVSTDTEYTANYSITASNPQALSQGLDVVDNMPKMKVIDFLTSIFKMFNLTAFYDDRRILSNGTVNGDYGKIKVMTLDDFYREGTSYNIDEYLYTDKHTVHKANIYSEIDFSYQDPSTFAIIKNNEFTNDEFGNEQLTNNTEDIFNPLAFDGGKYDVELGFEHMMFERMTDQSDDTDRTTVQSGWMVNEDEFPVLGKPLVFYCLKHSVGSYTVVTTSGDTISQYGRPANTLTTTSGTSLQSIHFGSENDEYFAEENTQSLFNNYYFNYIIPIYNEKSRLNKFKAILPISIINKFKLNDRFVVSSKSYKINKIKLNITTGEADLELINEFDILNFILAEDSDFLITEGGDYIIQG